MGCTVIYKHTTSSGSTTHNGSDTDDCYAIRGVISSFVEDEDSPTFSTEQGLDGRSNNLQYLEHHPIDLPQHAQRPQLGRYYVPTDQPDGATYNHFVVGTALVDQVTESSARVSATSGTSSGSIKPKCQFTLTVDGYGVSGYDCSEQFPDRKRAYTDVKPSELVVLKMSEGPFTWGTLSYGWMREHSLLLKDQAAFIMPGVYLEVFSPQTPPPAIFVTGTPNLTWQTKITGYVNAPDRFSYAFSSPRLKDVHEPITLIHRYFAGTDGQSWTGHFGGVALDTYMIRYWSNAIDHVKQ